jgi:hypothetical protein
MRNRMSNERRYQAPYSKRLHRSSDFVPTEDLGFSWALHQMDVRDVGETTEMAFERIDRVMRETRTCDGCRLPKTMCRTCGVRNPSQ